MRTITVRVLEDDVERARVIGAVRQQGVHEVLHAALDEYVINHHAELQGLFQAVQAAILSGDSAGLREAFASEPSRPATDDDARRAQELWETE